MFVSEISLRDADAYFKKKFGRWIHRLHRYILFAERVNFNDEMDFYNLVIDFCKDRNIRCAALSIRDFTARSFSREGIRIVPVRVESEMFDMLKALYVLYEPCKNFKIISRNLSGRFVPEDFSFIDLAKMELK